jgi:hypothetical protein
MQTNARSLPVVRDDRPTGKVLSIETGFSCNAYCGFCPQLNYRDDPEISLDLSTEEIREKIRYGAEHGYRHVGFSGGESTMRKDFIALVAHAKQAGFEHISVTSNGMMFSYPRFTEMALRAGLNSINVSVHGHTAKLHDAMMRTPGSFDLALKGIENIERERRRLGVKVDLMSMCLAAPQVIDHFPDQVRLMGGLGVKLHMLQPFLLTKGNTHLGHVFLSDWDKIQRAIREGSEAAQAHGGHIKLFNIPVCFFWDIESRLERQWKKLDVFREHERDYAGQSALHNHHAARHTPHGFYRIDACEGCDENCNGLRAEYYPQERMVAEITAAVDDHQALHRSDDLWLGGTELLSPDNLRTVLRHARAKTPGRLVLLTGAIGRAYREQFDGDTLALVDEVWFSVRPRNEKVHDAHIKHGNVDDVAAALTRIRSGSEGGRVIVRATVGVFPWVDGPSINDELLRLGLTNLVVGRNRLSGDGNARPSAGGPEPSLARERFWADIWLRVLRQVAAARARGFEVTLASDPSYPDPGVPIVDDTRRFVRHRWTTREFAWIDWSVPDWLAEEA